MTQAYSVRPRDGQAPVRIIEEEAAEAAAAAFIEDWFTSEGEEMAVIVRELETGREHCFRVDTDTGETKPCG